MIKRYFGLFILQFIVLVCLISPLVDATIPEDQDFYKWDYSFDNGYQNRHESVVSWNAVRGSAVGTSYSNGNSPEFRVWTSESRGKYQIDRSLCELDLTNVTNFFYVHSIKFEIDVVNFNDNNNNAGLYITNGTSFVYGSDNDYDYANHYFISPVSFRTPSGFVTVTTTGTYYITIVGTNGFNDYLRVNKLNISFTHGDDRNNNAPAVADDNYIDFNVDAITVNLVPVVGFRSHGDGWDLISVPVNGTVDNADLYVRSDANNYTWSNAVTNNVVQNCVYGFNSTSESYYLTTSMDGNVGYWIYLDSDYELWHTNFSAGGSVICVHNEDDYLFLSGLSFDISTVLLIIWIIFVLKMFEVTDMFVLFMLFIGIGLMSLIMFNEYTLFEIPVFLQISGILGVIAFYRAWRGK